MKPPSYREQNRAQCCGKCRYAGWQPQLDELMCYFGDRPDDVNESRSLDGDELDQWWCRRHVDCDGLCDEFRPGEPQNMTWANDYVKPPEDE